MIEPKFKTEDEQIRLYKGDCLEVLQSLKQEGIKADLIFADPPYFLSNNGITCQNGKMVKVNKGSWDKSKGLIHNHNFNYQWLRLCQDILTDKGTIFVSGTYHNIYSIGFALQQLEFKLLNNITMVKSNPPPNLACRRFTNSTETILWAAKSDKSKFTFNYSDMKSQNADKQMKDVWNINAPNQSEKQHGKHPTQKPITLLNRIIQAASNPNDLVLDPFNGSGTTAVACVANNRKYIGIEKETEYIELSINRINSAIEQATMSLFDMES